MGKSTALELAASVWGSRDYVQQWRATGNALEAVCEGHNHALLCLDELGQADSREAGETAYMIANGAGKNRSKARGGLRRKYQWQLLFLSTGEISLADKLSESGKKPRAGMLTRLADIPADAGKGYRMFDALGSFDDGHKMAQHLKQATANYYGVAIRSFLHGVASNYEALPAILQTIQNDFIAKYVPVDADGQVKRVASRFALVAAGGELAISSKILPYNSGEAMEAVATCFQAWIEERGGSQALETEQAISQVRGFIEAHHASRFITITDSGGQVDRVQNVAGYKRESVTGGYEFFVLGDPFRKEMCKGLDHKQVCEALIGEGHLLQTEATKFVSKHTLPIGRKRVYHLAPSILLGGE